MRQKRKPLQDAPRRFGSGARNNRIGHGAPISHSHTAASHAGTRLVVSTAGLLFLTQVVLTYSFALTGLMGVFVTLGPRVETLYNLVFFAVLAIAGWLLTQKLRRMAHRSRLSSTLVAAVACALVLSVFDLLLPAIYSLVPLSPGAAAANLAAIYADANFYVSYLAYGTAWSCAFLLIGSLANFLLVKKE